MSVPNGSLIKVDCSPWVGIGDYGKRCDGRSNAASFRGDSWIQALLSLVAHIFTIRTYSNVS